MIVEDPGRTVWKYKILHEDGLGSVYDSSNHPIGAWCEVEKTLCDLGRDGWELIYYNPDRVQFALLRWHGYVKE